jgi:2-methylcitrate dehydratase PrpD
VGTDVAAAVAGRAAPWEIGTDIGLQLKPYPSASATHAAIEAAQRAGAKAVAAAIARVEVGIAAETATALLAKYQRPRTGLQGKFSAEYCGAAALRWGEIDLGTFTDDKIRDPGIAGLLEKITVGVAAEPLVRDSGEHAATVTVTLASGEAITETMLTGKGKGENFMTREEVLAKFRTTAGAVISQSGAEQLFAAVYAGAAADPRVAGWLQGRAG